MIIVTGAAGFIGSCMVEKLNSIGISDIIMVDDFSVERKRRNWEHKQYIDKIDRTEFFRWARQNKAHIDFIIHLGARTDTTEFDYSVFEELNLNYSQQMWSLATQYGIPLLYASSAATYGNGEFGYLDDNATIGRIIPLNPYGKSKNEFDRWILKQRTTPPLWAGFKFFNVYGPNEYHKGRMASVVFHAFNQISEKGAIELFRSHRSDFKDGEQLRDFIYVRDVVSVLNWFREHIPMSGIYNLGTGFARSFLALANAVFKTMKCNPNILFIDIPKDIRDKYQYFTEAEMLKLRKCGYRKPFKSLEKGVDEYVSRFLMSDTIL